MARTEVILTQHIVGLGAESDQVKVAAGYARNYLYPHGFAIPLTGANKRRLEVLRQRRAEREAHDLNSMSELAASLTKITLRISVKTGADGKMFGAVTAGTIVDELRHQCDVTLDRKKVHMEHPLHALGDHEVELRLHPDVNAKLKVQIESSAPVEIPAAEGKTAAPHAGPAKEAKSSRPGQERKAGPEAKPSPRPLRSKPERKEKPKAPAA